MIERSTDNRRGFDVRRIRAALSRLPKGSRVDRFGNVVRRGPAKFGTAEWRSDMERDTAIRMADAARKPRRTVSADDLAREGLVKAARLKAKMARKGHR